MFTTRFNRRCQTVTPLLYCSCRPDLIDIPEQCWSYS